MEGKNEKEVGLTQSDQFWALENIQEVQRYPGLNPVNLNYYGMEQCEPGQVFGPFVRTNYLLHIVRSGKGKLYKNGTNYEVTAGQMFLIYPGEETTYQADTEQPWSYMWVGFHGFQAQEWMGAAGFLPDRPIRSCACLDEAERIVRQMRFYSDLTYANELLRTGLLYQLFGLLILKNEETPAMIKKGDDTDSFYVQTAVNLLTQSGKQKVRVEDAAAAIGISRGYLTRIFKKKMKMSPQEFQHHFRMERAGDLLRSTGNPVGAIAEELGYIDVMSFSKSFRRYYGVSPSEFRRQKVVVVKKHEKGEFTSAHPL